MNPFALKDGRTKTVLSGIAIAFFFILLPYLFFGAGRNFTKEALAQGDAIIFGMPTKILTARMNLWSQYEQGGTALMKDIGKQPLYPLNIIMNLFTPVTLAYNIFVLLQYTIAGYFTYLYLKTINTRTFFAIVGGISFMFCGFMVAHQGHNSMISAAAWLPAVMYPLELFFKKKKAVYLIGAAFCFAMSLVADYTAVSMYTGMVAFPYIIFRVWFEQYDPTLNTAKKLLITGLASAIVFGGGLLLAAPYVFSIIESLQYVTRESISYKFFAAYSFALWDFPIIFFPYYFGIRNTSALYPISYFGSWNPTELSGYMGIMPLLVATFSWITPRKKNKSATFWTIVAALGFLLVLGSTTPLYMLMYRVPIYNMFRVSARNWVEVTFAITVLFTIGLEKITHQTSEEKDSLAQNGIKAAAIIGGIVAFILAITWSPRSLIQLIILNIKQNAPNAVRSLTPEAFWSNTTLGSAAIYIPLIVISVSIIYFLALFKLSSKRWYVSLVLPLIIVDLLSFSLPYNGNYDFEATQTNEIYTYLQNAGVNAGERLYSLSPDDHDNLFPLFNVLYDVNVINGFGPIWLKRYKELTNFETNGISHQTDQLLTKGNKLISMFSAKYIITGDPKYTQLLTSTLGVMELPASPKPVVIFNGLKTPDWELFSGATTNNEIITLTSDGKNPSVASFNFALEKDMSYNIIFDVKGKITGDQPLSVDFYAGANFDLPEYEITIQDTKIKHAKVTFVTGEDIPSQTKLRFFTSSRQAIQISNVRMTKAPISIQYWGPTDTQGQQSYHLYHERFTSSQDVTVFENMNWLPRARFVKEARVANNFDEVKNLLLDDVSFRPDTQAVVEGWPEEYPTSFRNGIVLKEDYSDPDKVLLQVKTKENGFLVLADTWYPGWEAYIEGQRTKIYITNGVQRGIYLEGAGTHNLEFRFVSKSFLTGVITSLSTALLFIGLALYMFRRKP